MTLLQGARIVSFAMQLLHVVWGQSYYAIENLMVPSTEVKLIYQHSGVRNTIECASLCAFYPSCVQERYCEYDNVCVLYDKCTACAQVAANCSGNTDSRSFVLMEPFPEAITSEASTTEASTLEKNLVTGPDGVADNQLSESSFYTGYCTNGMAGKYARLNSTGQCGAWAPKTTIDTSDYVQVDFLSLKRTTCVVLTGRGSFGQFVMAFKLFHSNDCETFTPARDVDGNDQIFQGCSNADEVVTRCFREPLEARCIRINPTSYRGYKSLRFDILGY